MKVVLISSIVPGNSGGGSLNLSHHFNESDDMELLVVSDGLVPDFKHEVLKHRLSSRIFKRIARMRFSRWGADGQELFLPCNPNRVAQICRNFKPDVIVTVAHGGLSRLALREARVSKVPLVTIFHDWWPNLAGTHETLKPLLDRQFRALHRNSTVSLPVCEGMLSALGPHSGAQVLYPIPANGLPANSRAGVHLSPGVKKLKVIYMGNLGDYGVMVQTALEATKKHPEIRLEACGGNPAWPELFRNNMKERGLWHDFLPQELLGPWLTTADAFLVTMRFEGHLRRFMETSFPSKMVHYAQFHRPIVIWGPEYCSAVRWARKNDSALCVTDPSPTALVRALETLSFPERQRWAEKTCEAARYDFNPDRIQRQFVNALESVVQRS